MACNLASCHRGPPPPVSSSSSSNVEGGSGGMRETPLLCVEAEAEAEVALVLVLVPALFGARGGKPVPVP